MTQPANDDLWGILEVEDEPNAGGLDRLAVDAGYIRDALTLAFPKGKMMARTRHRKGLPLIGIILGGNRIVISAAKGGSRWNAQWEREIAPGSPSTTTRAQEKLDPDLHRSLPVCLTRLRMKMRDYAVDRIEPALHPPTFTRDRDAFFCHIRDLKLIGCDPREITPLVKMDIPWIEGVKAKRAGGRRKFGCFLKGPNDVRVGTIALGETSSPGHWQVVVKYDGLASFTAKMNLTTWTSGDEVADAKEQAEAFATERFVEWAFR